MKPGDIVECIEQPPYGNLLRGKRYAVFGICSDPRLVRIKNHGYEIAYHVSCFHLAEPDARPRYVRKVLEDGETRWLIVDVVCELPLNVWTGQKDRQAFTRTEAHLWARATGGTVVVVGRKP